MAIDLDTEARPIGYAYDPFAVLKRSRQHGLAERMLRTVELEQRFARRVTRRRVRQHGQQLQCGGKPNARSPDMRHVADAECRRHIGDLLALGKTAGRTGIGLQNVDRAPRQDLAKTPPRELALAARDRDGLAAAHVDIGIEIVGHDRLFKPADIAVATARPTAIASTVS